MGHDAELLAASGVGGEDQGIISNGSTIDYPCDNIAGWTPANIANGQVSQGAGFFNYEDTGYNASNVSRNYNYNLFTFPANFFVFTQFIEYSALRTVAQNNRNGTVDLRFNSTMRFLLTVFSDYIRIRPDSGDTDYAFAMPENEKVKITVGVTHDATTATADVFVNEDQIISDYDCNRTVAAQNNGINSAFVDRYNTGVRSITKLDRFLVGDDYA